MCRDFKRAYPEARVSCSRPWRTSFEFGQPASCRPWRLVFSRIEILRPPIGQAGVEIVLPEHPVEHLRIVASCVFVKLHAGTMRADH
jgi:hypothetical protein